MRLLVTGASGLLGLNLALEAARDHQVFGSVHLHPVRTRAFEVVQGDLTNAETLKKVIDKAEPDWIINCAALADLEACERHPALASALNEDLPARLALAARGRCQLIHLSTDAVFDGQRGGYSEEDQPNPLSVYARTKLAGEEAVLAANPQAMVARVNLFGWSLSGKRSLAEFFFNNLSQGRPVNGFTDVYFCPLFVNHLANTLLRMLEEDLQGLYHVVSSDCLSKYDFGVALAEKFGFSAELISPISVLDGGLQAARSPNLTLKNSKLVSALGEAPPPLSAGLEEFHRQYRDGYRERIFGLAA